MLRTRYVPLAGFSAQVPIHVCENGYLTDAQRTVAMQVQALQAAIATVDQHRSDLGVTDYRWFDLRDANSSYAGFESHHGLLYDNYTEKPAFAAFRTLVAQLAG